MAPVAAPSARGHGAARARSAVWLYGRGTDLLLGYGLGYLIAVPLLLALASAADVLGVMLFISTVAVIGAASPHYGATLLRVYEERSERRKYAFFAVWITAALAVLFGAALYERWLGSLLLTLYVSWSPWHFSGQNYGIAVMYLRRSGSELSAPAKRSLYAAFVLCAVLAIVVIHISDSNLVFARGAYDQSGTFGLLQLGIPAHVGAPLAGALALAYLGCLVRFAALLRPRPRLADLAPVACLVGAQSLWFAVPALVTVFGAAQVRTLLPFTALIISAAHSVQYLWVTSYYAGLARRAVRPAPFFGKCLLAGATIALPGLVFAPGLFGGSVPNGAGVLVLSFAVVNVHHFLLDGAIWKLRDGRVARALLRAQPETEGAEPRPAARRRWLRPALVAAGGIGLCVQLAQPYLMTRLLLEPAGGVLRSASRLDWLGHASPAVWKQAALRLEAGGEAEGAIAAWRASLGPHEPPILNASHLAWLLILHRSDDRASLDEAIALSSYVVEKTGQHRSEGLEILAAAQHAAGRPGLALATAERALAVAEASGQRERIQQIRDQLARYRADAL